MDIVKFTEVVFDSNVKKDDFKADDNGYHTVILGALNVYNSVGEFYTAGEALSLFNGSSILMRKIKNGTLYIEVGHPVKEPGMKLDEFYARYLKTCDTNICGHISEIWLDMKYGQKHPELNSPDMIAIFGKVKPHGVHAAVLKEALENPKINACFSVRGITENKYRNGRTERTLTNIVTWDHVHEPGISIATQAQTLKDTIATECYTVKEVTDSMVNIAIFKKMLQDQTANQFATEDHRDLCGELLKYLTPKQKDTRLASW